MTLLTPREYADAYAYWCQQTTNRDASDIEDQITPHVVRVKAERVRVEAVGRYGDHPRVTAVRRALLMADNPIRKATTA